MDAVLAALNSPRELFRPEKSFSLSYLLQAFPLRNFLPPRTESDKRYLPLPDDHLFSLLPGPLARSLELPEEARLGGEGPPLPHGSPMLDKLVHLATRDT